MTLESGVADLYLALLDAWNRRDAAGMADLYAAHGGQVGFDGSTANGPAEIEAHIAPIFANHPTGAFVGIVREVRGLGADAAILRAVAGLMPPGSDRINPATAAVQSLVASRDEAGAWRVEMFHNTPAAFHGRDGDREALLAELQAQADRAAA